MGVRPRRTWVHFPSLSGPRTPSEQQTKLAIVLREPELSDSELTAPAPAKKKRLAKVTHGALCKMVFLIMLPSGVLMVRYPKMTGSPEAL